MTEGTKNGDFDHCESCPTRHECKSVYEHIGHSRAPSVVLKALSAFILPIMLFIAAAVLVQHTLAGRAVSANTAAVPASVAGAAAVLIYIGLVKLFYTKAKNRTDESGQNGTQDS